MTVHEELTTWLRGRTLKHYTVSATGVMDLSERNGYGAVRLEDDGGERFDRTIMSENDFNAVASEMFECARRMASR